MEDFETFVRLVQDAFAHVHDRAALQGHPLGSVLGGATGLAAEKLHRTLISAIGWLRPLGSVAPGATEWRRYRHLQRRYLDGATSEQIAAELAISSRQARRDHAEAIEEVARLLWSQSQRVAGTTARSSSDRLETELASLMADTSDAPTDLQEVIKSVAETTSRLAEIHGVTVNLEPSEPPPSVATGRTVLRQLLLQLFSECIVHMPGATLTVAVSSSNTTIEVSITAEERFADPVAFELSRRLARSQKATLLVGEEPGGFKLRLLLPIQHAPTLLLVDDNPDLGILFRRYLSATSYQLVHVRTAERCLSVARDLLPDLVVLDVLLPSHDGWEILSALRTDPVTANLRVVICSVIPDHALALSLGVTEFLPKPVTRQALEALLASGGSKKSCPESTRQEPRSGALPAE